MAAKIPHIDGWLYVGMAIFTQAQVELSTSDASQVFSTPQLYWLKGAFALALAGFTAAKMYRSTSYADAKGKTDLTKPTTPETPATTEPKAP